MREDLFPYQLTEFIDKIDARYDGDPQGDYVMAEHMNDVQNAITRIEKALGVRPEAGASIEERLDHLKNYTPLEVPSVGYFDRLVGENQQYIQEIAKSYAFIILNDKNSLSGELSKTQKIYGQVVTEGVSLDQIQNEINAWKNQGASGIYLTTLDKTSRADEVAIVRSVTQEAMDLIVDGNPIQLFSNQVGEHNPRGEAIPFPESTLFVLKNFGYEEQLVQPDVVMSNLLPLVRLIKDQGHQVLGFADARSQSLYNSVHTLGLLLSLDYMYWGTLAGSTLERLPYTYNWNTMVGDWQTTTPNLFLEDETLTRYIQNGQIKLLGHGEVAFPGLELTSDGINWLRETIPGDSLEVASIPPDRLTTYDIQKIVDLINQAPEDIRIHPTKIDSNDQEFLLPTNIPASHLIQNVIEAVNKKNNRNSTEFQYIENGAIKALGAEKLIGDIPTDNLTKNTIRALNESSTNVNDDNPLYITVPYANITNLQGTGQLNYTEIIGDSATFENANVENVLTTFNIENNNLITSPRAEISEILADRIQVSRLEGLESLYVPELEADNIETLVLDAIEASIAKGTFDSIITQTLQSDIVITEIIRATTNFSELSDINQARITELISETLIAEYGFFGELAAGSINTDEIQLVSDSGLLNIQGDTIRVYSYPDENNVRNLRILIGHLEEVTGNEEDYGFVALSQDGETRILDHTGVYEAGIHKDSISEDKIQNDAVTGGKIRHDSILVDHLVGGTITGDWINGETITGSHIVGESITADHLQALSIQAHHIDGAIIDGTHIKGDVIEGNHIRASAISTDHLRVGFGVNRMKGSLDSFEQFNSGVVQINKHNTDVQTEIQNEYAYEGDNALRVMAYENNANLHIGHRLMVDPKKRYGLSLFTRIPQGFQETSVQLGAYLTDGEGNGTYVRSEQLNVDGFYSRLRFVVEDMQDYSFLIPVVTFSASNSTILIDGVQVEELAAGEEISPWKTTSTTVINGDNVNTGRVNANHIQIGQGTIFGDGDIITINNEGLSARSATGSAKLGSDGLVIQGGAFTLDGGQGEQSVQIDGQTGLLIENLFARVELNTEEGLRLTNKRDEQVILEIDQETGNLRFSGVAEFFSPDNPEMSLNILEQQEKIEQEKHQLSASTNAGSFQLFLSMKVNYSSYTEEQSGFLYFHGYTFNENLEYIEADVPGEVYVVYEDTYYDIENQNLDLRMVPGDTFGYIIWDNTRQELDFIYLEVTTGPDNDGEEIVMNQEWTRTKDTPNFEFNESVMVIGELNTN